MDEKERKQPDKKLSSRWTELEAAKSSIVNRVEEYAMWTLPYLFPPIGTNESTQLQGPLDSTGARAVNHLSNKLIMALFAPSQPFFRLTINDKVANELALKAKDGDEKAQAILNGLDEACAKAEKAAMRELDFNRYRTEATTAAKNLIVTGNAMLYHPEQGHVQCFSLRDYSIVRDLSGTVVEIVTLEKKDLNTFKKAVRDKLVANDPRKYDNKKEVKIYTQVKLEDDMKYHMCQYADDFELEESKGTWTAEDLPYLPLTWNLVRGEDYGRGLVEDYSGAFHALYQLAQAEVNVVAIAADIKFLVDPASTIDVEELNEAESGTYHSGKKDDVSSLQLDKAVDMQMVESMVQRLQQQIGAAFLLQTAVTRDAERVTAEEIRQNANELDMSNGGIYSRFAEEWQYRTAVLMLKRTQVDLGPNKNIDPVIITGLDSLSRAGDMDNMRLLISDLASLAQIPDSIIAAIDPNKFLAYCAIRRGVEVQKIAKSPQQQQAEVAQEQQQQQQLQDNEAAGNIATEAAKGAIKQTGEQ